jgi:hypothetical protein
MGGADPAADNAFAAPAPAGNPYAANAGAAWGYGGAGTPNNGPAAASPGAGGAWGAPAGGNAWNGGGGGIPGGAASPWGNGAPANGAW